MIIPGLSGSFLLIILGNYVLLLVDSVNVLYDSIISLINGDFEFLKEAYTISRLKIISVFSLGSITGLLVFSKLMSLLLKKFNTSIQSLIFGFIIGSLGVLWPWKNTDPNSMDINRYLPEINTSLFIAILYIFIGIFIVLALSRYERSEINKLYGLLGKNIDYSFSKDFFSKKFNKENLNCSYMNFDIQEIDEFKKVINEFKINGLNVTIPYKESIIKYLDFVCPIAKKIGAVNTIKFENSTLSGYNTDYLGFYKSVQRIVKPSTKALILGTGGASKAVAYALKLLGVKYIFVSRSKENEECISYEDLNKSIINKHKLIINCTPLGTYPMTEEIPKVPISLITSNHTVYDLIYNPTKSLLLEKSEENGAKIINGYQMLQNQAIESWNIWNR